MVVGSPTKGTVAILLAWLLSSPAALAKSKDPSDSRSSGQWVEATLVEVDSTNARATYTSKVGATRTSSVGSPEVVTKLAKMKPGQQVKLKCVQATPEDDVVIEDAKKKTNKWKLVLYGYLVLAGVYVVAFLAGGGA